MDFTINAQKYENQLLTKKEQETISPEKLLNRLKEQQVFQTGFEGYRVHFDTKEEFLEGQQVLASDDALVQYYEKNDPEMLQGLKSKSFINIAGKKAEKKLRRKYVAARSEKEVELADAKKLRESEIARAKKDGRWGLGERPYPEVEDAVEGLKQKDTEAIIDCFKLMGKKPEELSEIRKKVSGLGYLRRQQLKKLASKSLPMDADLNGVDNEMVKEKQDKYAKSQAETATWESYRAVRDVAEYKKNRVMPEDAEQKRKKYNETHTTQQIGSEAYNRAASVFMREVKYTTKNGKKVPATEQDEKNLAWNNKFIDSLLSDKEEDWNFRFEEMERIMKSAWEECAPLLKKVQDGTFDYKKDSFGPILHSALSSQLLCISGTTSKRTRFFKSDYFNKLDPAYGEELEARFNAMASLMRVMDYKYVEIGIEPTTYTYKDQRMDYNAIVAAMLEEVKRPLPKCNL